VGLQAVRLLVLRLAQVGVADHAPLARELDGVAQQFGGDRKGRAGGQRDPAHGVRPGVVVLADQAVAVLQDRLRVLHHVVRRQSALRAAAAHAAARGVEPRAHAQRHLDLHVQELLGRAAREYIEVVRGGGAAGQQQLADPHARADLDGLGVQLAPDFVEPHQPVEQLGVLHGRDVAGQRLVQVVVRVDEAGIDHAAGGLDHAGAGGRAQRRPHGGDAAALQQHVHPVERLLAVHHGHQRVAVPKKNESQVPCSRFQVSPR
jgi:hypothetical protein